MSASNTLDERFDEIKAATTVSGQVNTILELAKRPRLDKSRGERVAAWQALSDTVEAHIAYLHGVQPAKRKAKAKAPAPTPPIETTPLGGEPSEP